MKSTGAKFSEESERLGSSSWIVSDAWTTGPGPFRGICLTCNASQFSHGLQYYWNDPELYASHWSLVNISTDSFLLLTGHLNIALFPKTKVFSHEISNSFSLWDCPISNNKPSNWNICYQFPFSPHIILWNTRKKNQMGSEKIKTLPYTPFLECIIFINNESNFPTLTIRFHKPTFFPFIFQSLYGADCVVS